MGTALESHKEGGKQWEEKIRLLEADCAKTCKLYQYLGVLAGLLVTVVLL